MAAGLPIVASRVGGVPELVEDGVTGLTVPPRNPAALAEALRRLLTDATLRARLGAAGRLRAEQAFSLVTFRRAHLDLYRELTTGRGASGSSKGR